MRHRSFMTAVGVAAVGCVACASVFSLDAYSTSDSADAMTGPEVAVSALEASSTDSDAPPTTDDTGAPGCVTNAECTARATTEGPLTAMADSGAPAAPDGAIFTGRLEGGVVPAVCVQSVHKCARLLTPDCPAVYGDFSNDNAVVLGTFFTTTGALTVSNVSRQQAALLAAEEINSPIAGGGLPSLSPQGPPRPLVVLECDPSQSTMRTAAHLINDLHVPAIVGPNAAQDVIDVTQQVSARGGTLLMSPTALASPITYLVDNGLTLRDVPSDDQRSKLVMREIGDIEAMLHAARGPTLKLGIVYRNDALGLSARDSISGKVIFNGHFLSDPLNSSAVSVDHYDTANDVASQLAIADHYQSFAPDIVFVTGQEQVTNVVLALERKLQAANASNRPYYVCTDAAKVQAFFAGAGAAGVASDFATRVRGIGVRPDGDSAAVFATFNTAFTSRYGSNPRTSGMGSAYDAVYSIAYAIAANGVVPVTGASIAQGLGSLGAGDRIDVGQSQANLALQTLAAGKSISLRGTFSAMLWDSHGDIVGGTAEVWCLGASGGAAGFASSGLTMDVGTQVISGAYVQCP